MATFVQVRDQEMKKDFQYSDQPESHKERTKQILKAHPEVRNLIGRNPVSALITFLVVTFQFVIAYLLADLE